MRVVPRPHRSARLGAVCGGGGGLLGGQSLPLFARGPADERKRPRTGAAPAWSGVDAQAPAGTPRPTQSGGGGRSSRGGRRCRAFGAARARTRHGDDLRHGGGRAAGLRASGSRESASARRRAQPAGGALLAGGAAGGVAEAAASRSFDEALWDLSRHTGAEVPQASGGTVGGSRG